MLSLFATVVQQLKVVAEPEVPRILEATFECTLAMITKNFEDYPEHRINFFMLLKVNLSALLAERAVSMGVLRVFYIIILY